MSPLLGLLHLKITSAIYFGVCSSKEPTVVSNTVCGGVYVGKNGGQEEIFPLLLLFQKFIV